MKGDMETNVGTLDDIEKDVTLDNPPVIREYLAANDEEKGFFEVCVSRERSSRDESS